MTLLPQFPIYIPSKSRAKIGMTWKALDLMGVPYHVIIEAQQYDEYAAVLDPAKLLILDPKEQDRYDPFDRLGRTKSLGSGPARNMAWEHAAAGGHARHWTMDDNISCWFWLLGNQKLRSGDAGPLVAMEDFVLRYKNIAMAGPQYDYFIPARTKTPPFATGTRIFSCNLIRTDLPFRWRGRYNEDVDLSIRMLKAGWNTVLFHAFLQQKIPTGQMKGGNAEELYRGGTLAKSQMLVAMHPDIVRLAPRYGRMHHQVSLRRWQNQPLVPNPDAPPPRDWHPTVQIYPKRRRGPGILNGGPANPGSVA